MYLFVWNINGLGPTYRNIALQYGDLKTFFQHYHADVVCLQETKVQGDRIDEELACVDGYESFWATSKTKKGYSGVCTWVTKQYSPIHAATDFLGGGDDDFDTEGRIVLTDLGAFVLINVYVPNAGDPPKRPRLETKLQFLKKLKRKLEVLREENRQVMVVGDFNIAATKDDLHKSFSLEDVYTTEEIDSFRDLLTDHVDVWRSFHPEETDTFTVFNERKSYRESNKGLRIDYALVSQDLMDKVVSCEVIETPKKWSDHTGLLLELKNIPPVQSHRLCALSSLVRFKKQKTLVSMFGGRKRKAEIDSIGKADKEEDQS